MSSPARTMLLLQHLMFLSFLAVSSLPAFSSSSVASKNGATVKLQPTLEEIPGGSRAIWQIPPSPEAILFVAHGLNHGPEVFWDPNSSCPACSGLPEERLITMTALAGRYAVLTVAALMKVGWDKRPDLEVNVDFQQVTAFLRYWRDQHGLTDLPLTAFGLSRGGDFASLLPLGEKVEGLVLMISAGNDQAFAAATTDGGLWPYPPTLFIYMPKDNMTADSVKENTALLSNNGLITENLLCNSFPVYETYFSERITGLDKTLSKSIFRALGAKGYLTPEGYISKPDPVSWENYGHWDWSRVARMLRVLPSEGNASFAWDEEVAEELSLSFAFHCCSGFRAQELLDWLGRAWKRPALAQGWASL